MFLAGLVLLAAYLIGSIPFPVIVSRLVMGIDLRQHGSGNMGATNAARVLGKRWFPVVLGLDLTKGAAGTYLAACYLTGQVGISPVVAAAAGGLGVVAGHCFPLFAGFRGGVGLAASAGALLILSPPILAGVGLVILAVWAASRNMHVGVAASCLAFPALAWYVLGEPAAVGVIGLWGLLVLFLHRKDVAAWWERQR